MRNGVDCRDVEWEENLNKLKPEKDLTGQKFGRLLVLFRVQNNKQGDSQWLCLCDCGNEVVIKGASLRNGHTTSCGCAHRDNVSKKLAIEFYSGQKIGYWTVMYRADGYIGKGAYWHCKCICGNEKDISAGHLRSGVSISCGCVQRKIISEQKLINLTDMRFGRLTITGRSNRKVPGDVYWNYKCDCGKVGYASGHNLRRGSTLSCGCLSMSNGEYHIFNILNSNNIDYIYNRAYFKDLKNYDGNLLRYDFILFDNYAPYRIIEFDGKQHDEPVGFFGGIEGFEKTQKNDAVKNQYALSHNIPLVRIPYSKRDTMTLNDLIGDKYLIKGEM